MRADPDIVNPLLRLIEETVPIPLLTITNSEHPDTHCGPFEGASIKEIYALMGDVYAVMLSAKVNRSEALERLAVMEPFDRYPELVETFKEQLRQQ